MNGNVLFLLIAFYERSGMVGTVIFLPGKSYFVLLQAELPHNILKPV